MRHLNQFAMTLTLFATSAALAAPFKVKAPASWKDVSTEKDLRIYENTKSKSNHEMITTVVARRMTKDDALFSNMDAKRIPEIQKARGGVLSRMGLHNYTLLDIQKVQLPKSKFKFMQVLQSRYRNPNGVEVQMLERQYIGKSNLYVVTYLIEGPALNDRATAERLMNFFNPNEDGRTPASVADYEISTEGEVGRAPAAASLPAEVVNSGAAAPAPNSRANTTPAQELPDALDKPTAIPAFDITKPENQELCKDVEEDVKRKPGESSALETAGEFMWGCLAKGVIWDNTIGAAIGIAKLAWGVAKVMNPFDNTYSDQVIASAGAIGAEAKKDPKAFAAKLAVGVWNMIKGIEGKPFDCYNNTEQWRKICNVTVAVATLGTGSLVSILSKSTLAPELIMKANEALKASGRVALDSAKVLRDASRAGKSAMREGDDALRAAMYDKAAAKSAEKATQQTEKAASAQAAADEARATVDAIKNGTRVKDPKSGLFERIKKTFPDGQNDKRAALVDRVLRNDEAAIANYDKAVSVHGSQAVSEALAAQKLGAFKSAADKEKFVKETLETLSNTSKEAHIAAKEAEAAAAAAAAAAETPSRMGRVKDAFVDAKDTIKNTREARAQDATAKKATAEAEKFEQARFKSSEAARELREGATEANNKTLGKQKILDASKERLAQSKAEARQAYKDLGAQLKQTPKDIKNAFLNPKEYAKFAWHRKFTREIDNSIAKLTKNGIFEKNYETVVARGMKDELMKTILTQDVRKMKTKDREAFIRAQVKAFSEVPESAMAGAGGAAGAGAGAAAGAGVGSGAGAAAGAGAQSSAEAAAGALPRLPAPSESLADIQDATAAANSGVVKPRAFRLDGKGEATLPSTAAKAGTNSADAPKVAENLRSLPSQLPSSAFDDFRAAMKLGQTKSIDEVDAIIRAGKAQDLATAWRAHSALAPAERAKALVDDIARLASGGREKAAKDMEKALEAARQSLGNQNGFAGNNIHTAALDRAVSESLSNSENRMGSMVQALLYHEGPPENLTKAIDKTKGLTDAQKRVLKNDLEAASSTVYGKNGIKEAYAKEFSDLRAYKGEDPAEIAGLIAQAEARGVERATIKKTIKENMGKCTVAQ